MDRIIVENVKDFNLRHIFDCGQCFRWQEEADGTFTGAAMGKVVNMEFRPDEGKGFSGTLIINNGKKEDEKLWRKYLDLDRDYGAIKKWLRGKDDTIREAISYGEGIRILQQEKWETLLSFIISQNNNIPRIKKNIDSVCSGFGEPAGEYKGRVYCDFPSPEKLASLSVEDLADCRLGYRAKYIIQTARQVTEDGMKKLESMGAEDVTAKEAFDYITGMCGVGPKVANCILLFSMGKYESFPIDTWVKKVMHKLYGIGEEDKKTMESFAKKNFGPWGGIAQQYLFYYIKENFKEL